MNVGLLGEALLLGSAVLLGVELKKSILTVTWIISKLVIFGSGYKIENRKTRLQL